MIIPKIIYAVFLVSLGYFLILTAYYLFLALIGSYESLKRSFEGEAENYSLMYFSSFKIPVSFIIPCRNESGWISDCVQALLALNYPAFEIIVVNDGSTDNTLEVLDNFLKLKKSDTLYIAHHKDGQVHNIFTSQKYPNVTVIDKGPGFKKAGAANAGLNLARNNYVCVVDADTILERDALLKVMAHVEKDPDRIIGVGSYFGLVNGFKVRNGAITARSFSYNPLVAYQNLEYIRSFIGNRLAWSRYNSMPVVAGGFGLWRRDILYELGGYSAEFTCEDMEWTFRAHDYAIKNRDKGYKIIMLPYCVGWTEGPSNIKSLVSQRSRWQRVTDETIWRYKYMICNPRFGLFAFLVLPYFVMYEVLGVFFEITSIIFLGAGWAAGLVDWRIFAAFFTLMILSQAFTSLLSVLAFVEGQRLFRKRYVMYLVFLGFMEFFWYRWIISIAKIHGTLTFLMGRKSHEQYVRAKRV